MRIQLIELPNLAIRSPTEIALPSITHIYPRYLCEAPCRIEACGEFVGDGLVVHKAVCVCGADRGFVEMFGVECPPFDARDLCFNERRFRFEICGAMQCPYLELSVMVVQSDKMRLSLFGRS